MTATGELYTWGSDSDGQLGRPRRPGSLRGPAAEAFDPVVKASTEPMKIHRVTAGGLDRHDVIDAAVGDAHTLALTADGTLWAWGSNRAGQLGRLDCAERSHHPKGQPRLANASDPDSPVVFGGYEKGNGTGCEAYGAPATGRIATPGPLELSLRFRPYRGHPMERLRVRDMDLEPVKFRAVAAAASYTVAIRADPAPGTPRGGGDRTKKGSGARQTPAAGSDIRPDRHGRRGIHRRGRHGGRAGVHLGVRRRRVSWATAWASCPSVSTTLDSA